MHIVGFHYQRVSERTLAVMNAISITQLLREPVPGYGRFTGVRTKCFEHFCSLSNGSHGLSTIIAL